MKFNRFDGEVELSAYDLKSLQNPDEGPRMLEALEPEARRLMLVALMPARSALIERFSVEPAPPVRISWVPDGAAAVTRFDGDLTIVGASHVKHLPAILSTLLRIDPAASAEDRHPVRTTVGEINGLGGGLEPGSEPGGGAGSASSRYVGAWRCSGGWANLPADLTITVAVEADATAWLVDVDSIESPVGPLSEVQLIPVGGADLLGRLRHVVVGTSARVAPAQPADSLAV